jgi:hypothetical protein
MAWALVGLPTTVLAQADPDALRAAKSAFFDRDYERARGLWTDVQVGGGDGSEAAVYWIARCSENLGDWGRAMKEYSAFLAEPPRDALLAEEAETSRVGLAARSYKAGDHQHLDILERALRSDSRTVRYYAALQFSTLPADVGAAAVPVLRGIVARESDTELVDRARLALLRLDPTALRSTHSKRTGATKARWIKLRIFEAGNSKAEVSLDLPLALAELLFKSLPEDARAELSEQGYEAESFFEQLRTQGAADLVEIRSGDGGRIRIWIE